MQALLRECLLMFMHKSVFILCGIVYICCIAAFRLLVARSPSTLLPALLYSTDVLLLLLPRPQDMTPYVPLLMPELQKALLDPLPEVRATAARAMGSLLKGMGAAALGDLLPWLLATLRSEGSSVERSGAAQVSAGVAFDKPQQSTWCIL